MGRDLGHGLPEIVVVLETGGLFRLVGLHLRSEHTLLSGQRSHRGAHPGMNGHFLRDQVREPLERILGGQSVSEGGGGTARHLHRVHPAVRVEQLVRKGLEPLHAGFRGAGVLPRFEGAEEVLQRLPGVTCPDPFLQLGGELPLLFERPEHAPPA